MTGMTSASQSTNDATANARTVEAFLYALQDQDFDTADSMLADNIVWQNVGINTMRGRKRIMKLFRLGEGRGSFEVKFHGGQITLWRDYVDRLDFFVIAPLRALAALVIPSLRPTM
jgi:limonene-1,2-epoxide hydrolase